MSIIQFLFFNIGNQYPLISIGVAVASLFIGLFSLLSGYKIVKFLVFFSGFAVTAVVVSFLLNGWIGLLAGLVVGTICVACWYIGVFMLGMGTGAAFAIVLGIDNSVAIFIFGLIGGFLAIAVRKFMIIVSTSFLGASLLTGLVGLFLDNPPTLFMLIVTLALACFGIRYQYKSSRATVEIPAKSPKDASDEKVLAKVEDDKRTTEFVRQDT